MLINTNDQVLIDHVIEVFDSSFNRCLGNKDLSVCYILSHMLVLLLDLKKRDVYDGDVTLFNNNNNLFIYDWPYGAFNFVEFLLDSYGKTFKDDDILSDLECDLGGDYKTILFEGGVAGPGHWKVRYDKCSFHGLDLAPIYNNNVFAEILQTAIDKKNQLK